MIDREDAVLVKPEEINTVTGKKNNTKKGYGRECPVCYRPGKLMKTGAEGNRYFCEFCNINWPE